MAHRCEFYLYKRKKKRGSYWYVCYLDRKTGKQLSAKSIDCLKERLGIMEFSSVSRREDAAIIAHKALESGLIFDDKAKKPFVDYCREYWDYDNSEYIAMRNHLNKDSIGREYAYNMLKAFNKHVAPRLPDGLKLCNVTTRILDGVMKELYGSGIASGTIQILEYTFSCPLKEAVRLGYLGENPADRILRITRTEKPRGVLTHSEVEELLAVLNRMKGDLFSSYYYGILLAVTTGMRCSEIRALSSDDIVASPIQGYHRILVRHSIAYFSGKKGTKGKYERSLLVPSAFALELLANADENGIVLPSRQEVCLYMSAPSLRSAFYQVLNGIGIDEGERKRRNITFHSLRHTFSTLSRDAHISQEDRMVVLGHKSTEVNDRYTHSSDEALRHVSVLTASLLENESFPFFPSAEKGAED